MWCIILKEIITILIKNVKRKKRFILRCNLKTYALNGFIIAFTFSYEYDFDWLSLWII